MNVGFVSISRKIQAGFYAEFAVIKPCLKVDYYSSEAAAQDVVNSITSNSGRAVAVKVDVYDPQQVNSMVQRVADTLGASEMVCPRM